MKPLLVQMSQIKKQLPYIAGWLQSNNSLNMSKSTIVDIVRSIKDISAEHETLQHQNLIDYQIPPEEALKTLNVVLGYVRQRNENVP